jgi:hypothetical protein
MLFGYQAAGGEGTHLALQQRRENQADADPLKGCEGLFGFEQWATSIDRR